MNSYSKIIILHLNLKKKSGLGSGAFVFYTGS